ncbi:MAG: PRTRC system protein B [Sphingobacteriales bacterium]|nr:MAG: PRTRC system protein B [Sphingobacteriales bacterium]
MTDITHSFGTPYVPLKALVLYRSVATDSDVYVESYDFDANGCPINAHPLSISESNAFAKALNTAEQAKHSFLKAAGIVPKNILFLNTDGNSYAVWYTPARTADLLFVKGLSIQNGKAHVPALVWKATKTHLSIFAVAGDEIITVETPLCHAPFFNLYKNGQVCMGNVAINIPRDCHLEHFMASWEHYFFNSYFSHLIQGLEPVKGNVVQLWQSLVGTGEHFPNNVLKSNGHTLKDLHK